MVPSSIGSEWHSSIYTLRLSFREKCRHFCVCSKTGMKCTGKGLQLTEIGKGFQYQECNRDDRPGGKPAQSHPHRSKNQTPPERSRRLSRGARRPRPSPQAYTEKERTQIRSPTECGVQKYENIVQHTVAASASR
ncbi:hypothetical protein DACRYDRAFT_92272 [Dacryopinax primogenitus]|uniref:Uncharacterized protein n=1 Tax=Dacryopinax primogenitus (strain DJM 731) TaxID=1858805 RepID=M5G7E6_DACPD|nr:uncharacterized protein DACRYDRAFT_92272 [Dacryopinax primogenitus]EJU06146.1 hypothetical protein DACRYDRAFT_92272 [Dacryopinax primogenitus]